jgi:hypothetical protein
MQIETRLEKLAIDYKNKSMQLRVQDYVVDEQTGSAMPLMNRNNNDTLLPGDDARLDNFVANVSDANKVAQVKALKSELWTKEVVDARYMREGLEAAGVVDKPEAEWTNEEKRAFNSAVPEAYHKVVEEKV